MPVPDFSPGEVLTAAAMDSIGLWLVKTQTIGTTVSSVTVTDAFSAVYDNYLITIAGGSGTTSTNLNFQLGAANTGYHYTLSYSSYTNTPLAIGTATDTTFAYAGSATANSLGMYLTLQNPFLTEETFVQGSVARPTFAGTMAGVKRDTTSYADFTVIVAAGTVTGGTIRVYGYRN
jgi:hypothetical protein